MFLLKKYMSRKRGWGECGSDVKWKLIKATTKFSLTSSSFNFNSTFCGYHHVTRVLGLTFLPSPRFGTEQTWQTQPNSAASTPVQALLAENAFYLARIPRHRLAFSQLLVLKTMSRSLPRASSFTRSTVISSHKQLHEWMVKGNRKKRLRINVKTKEAEPVALARAFHNKHICCRLRRRLCSHHISRLLNTSS